jgi:hypothetical protein
MPRLPKGQIRRRGQATLIEIIVNGFETPLLVQDGATIIGWRKGPCFRDMLSARAHDFKQMAQAIAGQQDQGSKEEGSSPATSETSPDAWDWDEVSPWDLEVSNSGSDEVDAWDLELG